MKFFVPFFLFLISCSILLAAEYKGVVRDLATGESLTGATITVKNGSGRGWVTGLDGSFRINRIERFPCVLVCGFVGYEEREIVIRQEEELENMFILLAPAALEMETLVVYADGLRNTESSARTLEKEALGVLNVMSTKAIELSPDLTVANVIQRMSGVTIERTRSGDGQYALLRGMDKRFNYTEVNGVKIPSPDAKNRFVPLDIFPSELLDRLEVSKSLTANMEADGVGGAVNMVMKDAPPSAVLTANISTGYNTLFFDRDFEYFDRGKINKHTPNDRYGESFLPDVTDFTRENLDLKSRRRAYPNLNGGISYGNRFFKKRVGLMLAGSYQHNARGSNSDTYGSANSEGVQSITNRTFSETQGRLGLHAKIDALLTPEHKLVGYAAYMDFTNTQVRNANSGSSQNIRLRYSHQTIESYTLKGLHRFGGRKAFNIDWSLVYSNAFNEIPDQAQINLTNGSVQTVSSPTGAVRSWQDNSDQDQAAYLNFTYKLVRPRSLWELSAGGMYRNKDRTSQYHQYSFQPFDPGKDPAEQRRLVRGEDWNNFSDIKFQLLASTVSDPLNYDASEKTGAAYLQAKFSRAKLTVTGGLRAEHTDQGYDLKYPVMEAQSSGSQKYWELIPSLSARFALNERTNIRGSYYKALNRPSFFEIVPYNMIFEEYKERGNPDIKHTVAHNADLRFELFPGETEQFMVGVFYKKIIDPIEYGDVAMGQDTYYMPLNLGKAYNTGVEVDIMKYFSVFGIRANYTYTHSKITTSRMTYDVNEENIETSRIDHTRPLFGQAPHVANLSLLYKSRRSGIDAQFSFNYTGKKLVVISRWVGEDTYQAGSLQLDASAEKRFKNGLTIFAKASNLLDTPMKQFIDCDTSLSRYDDRKRSNGGVLDRKDYYGRHIMLGVRFRL